MLNQVDADVMGEGTTLQYDWVQSLKQVAAKSHSAERSNHHHLHPHHHPCAKYTSLKAQLSGINTAVLTQKRAICGKAKEMLRS